MNITSVSNVKFTAVKNDTPANTAATSNHQDNPIVKDDKGDSWNFTINKKKAAKFAAIGTLLAAATAGIIYTVKKGSAPAGAHKAVKDANEFVQTFRKKFQSTIDETVAIYNNGGKDAQGNIVAKITEDTDNPGIKWMKNISKEGETPTITSVFVNDKIGSIKKLRNDGKFDKITFKDNGQISICREGITVYDNIRRDSTDKIAFLQDNKPYMYAEKEFFDGNICKRHKQVGISKTGKPISYMENYTSDNYGNYTAKTWMALLGHGLGKKWHNLAQGMHKAS